MSSAYVLILGSPWVLYLPCMSFLLELWTFLFSVFLLRFLLEIYFVLMVGAAEYKKSKENSNSGIVYPMQA